MNPFDLYTAEELTANPIERLTEAEYLERAQQKAIEAADQISRSRLLSGQEFLLVQLIQGNLDGGLIDALESAKQHGWYQLLQDVAADIVMAAAVCGDPKRANFYGAIAGIARGTHHDDLVRFIKGAKP